MLIKPRLFLFPFFSALCILGPAGAACAEDSAYHIIHERSASILPAFDQPIDPDRYQLRWLNDFAGAGGAAGSDEARNMAIDGDGNVVTVGIAYRQGGHWGQYGIVKYAPDGSFLWSDEFALDSIRHSWAQAVATDKQGNIYTTGWGREAGTTGRTVILTLKHNPNGDLLWHRKFASGTSHNTQPQAIALDGDGRVVIAGAVQTEIPTGGFRGVVLLLDQEGEVVWNEEFGTTAWTVFHAVTVDKNGDILLGGTTGGNNIDLLVARYSRDGDLLWFDKTGAFGYTEIVWDVAVDGQGNSYALGDLAPSGLGSSFHLMKYSYSGDKLWSRSLSHISDSRDYPRRVALAPDGNIVVAGTGGMGLGVDSVMVAKYSPEGGLLWSTSYKGGRQFATADDMVIASDGSIFTTGYTRTVDYGTAFFNVAFDGNGQVIWDDIINGNNIVGEFGIAIALDRFGNPHVAGRYWSARGGSSFGTAQYKSKWSARQ